MHKNQAAFAVTMILLSLKLPAALSQDLALNYITQYCNESIETVNIASDERLLTDISNSLMTAEPIYLNEAIYLTRRTNFVNLCPELDGIGEVSHEWLRPNRVTLSEDAVVVAAVRENRYPGAESLLTGLGWTLLPDTITIDYSSGALDLPLYAGLLPAGPVNISGAGVNNLGIVSAPGAPHSHYFFFQETSAFSPQTLAQFELVPEPGTFLLLACGIVVVIPIWILRT